MSYGDILVSAPAVPRTAEHPGPGRNPRAAETRPDRLAVWDCGMRLAEQSIGRYIPVRFLSFSVVGSAGLVVHMAVLVALRAAAVSFTRGQALAILVAMTFNFWLNNLLTYRDRRLRGGRWLTGLLSFMLACGLGAVANVSVASYLVKAQTQWTLAALSGIAVGAVWNYGATQLCTWGHERSQERKPREQLYPKAASGGSIRDETAGHSACSSGARQMR